MREYILTLTDGTVISESKDRVTIVTEQYGVRVNGLDHYDTYPWHRVHLLRWVK